METLQQEYQRLYEYRNGHLYHRRRENLNFEVEAYEAGGDRGFSHDNFHRGGKRVGGLHRATNTWRFKFNGDHRPIDRAIYIYHHGQIIDGFEDGLSLRHKIEHIDGDPLNNRIENLRRVDG